jgi:hypothetical protein
MLGVTGRNPVLPPTIRLPSDFDREVEAVGMLIKLNERRKAS